MASLLVTAAAVFQCTARISCDKCKEPLQKLLMTILSLIIPTYYNHEPLVDNGLYIKMHGSCGLPIFSAGKMRFYAQGLGFITQKTMVKWDRHNRD